MGWSETGVDLAVRVRDAYQGYVEHLHAELAAAGYGDVRPSHASVFQHLEPGGSSLTDLARRAGLTRQAIWYLVGELERAGYVHRVADATDGRRKLVRLTPRGVAMSAVARDAVRRLELRAVQSLGDPGALELRRLLDALLEALRASEPSAPHGIRADGR